MVENDEGALTKEFEEFFGRNCDLRLVNCRVDTVHRADVIEEVRDTEDEIVIKNVEAMSKDIVIALPHHKDPDGAGKQSKGTGCQLVADVVDTVIRNIEVFAHEDTSRGVPEESLDRVAD